MHRAGGLCAWPYWAAPVRLASRHWTCAVIIQIGCRLLRLRFTLRVQRLLQRRMSFIPHAWPLPMSFAVMMPFSPICLQTVSLPSALRRCAHLRSLRTWTVWSMPSWVRWASMPDMQHLPQEKFLPTPIKSPLWSAAISLCRWFVPVSLFPWTPSTAPSSNVLSARSSRMYQKFG